ncbi:MAG: chemotaxis protein CheD [Armatimonadetes bacterium]|nr:chemotaxis protein CheD [Armatimonadota bacterium]
MAEIAVARKPILYTCLGLGSCVAVCALDTKTGVSGVIHVMLPETFKNRPVEKAGKFADTGVPELVRQMEEAGAIRGKIVVAYSGGASVFQFGNGKPGFQDVGTRNGAAVEKAVESLGLPVIATDVGGTNGRSLFMCSESGEVRVRTVRHGEFTLCNLRGKEAHVKVRGDNA